MHVQDKDLALLLAELWFCFHHEMIVTLSDFFLRRTGRLNFDIHSVLKWKEQVADEFGHYAGWPATRRTAELQQLDILVSDARLSG
jgi:glycerol kinase